MGYRSDVRIRLTKEDYERLKEEFEEKLIKTKILNWNLFDHLDIYKELKDYEMWEKTEDCVYFGWNYVKWYDDYEDVELIMDFITDCEQYAFIRIGESGEGDIETIEENMDMIGYYYAFDDDEGGNT